MTTEVSSRRSSQTSRPAGLFWRRGKRHELLSRPRKHKSNRRFPSVWCVCLDGEERGRGKKHNDFVRGGGGKGWERRVFVSSAVSTEVLTDVCDYHLRVLTFVLLPRPLQATKNKNKTKNTKSSVCWLPNNPTDRSPSQANKQVSLAEPTSLYLVHKTGLLLCIIIYMFLGLGLIPWNVRFAERDVHSFHSWWFDSPSNMAACMWRYLNDVTIVLLLNIYIYI